jgi:hypothetical protein
MQDEGLRVIGAGFGRTGTYSLKAALDSLGMGPTYHMTEVFAHPEHAPIWQAAAEGEDVDWDALLAGYHAAVDWPASAFFKQLMEHYPDAKVILTVRDPERWHESGRNTIFPGAEKSDEEQTDEQRAWGAMADTVIWNGIFDGKVLEPEHAIDVFNRHIAMVKATVPPERLLLFEAKDGWEPLCAFLGVPVPDEPYPRLNDTQSFKDSRGLQPQT